MGFIRAAFVAGKRPKTTPIRVEKAADTTMAGTLMEVAVFIALERSCARPMPARIPSIPPSVVRAAASVRNCMRILRCFAPRAFRQKVLALVAEAAVRITELLPIDIIFHGFPRNCHIVCAFGLEGDGLGFVKAISNGPAGFCQKQITAGGIRIHLIVAHVFDHGFELI